MSFETVSPKDEWLSGSVSAGLMITSTKFAGETNIAPPVVLQVNCLGLATQADSFSVDIGFEIPLTCVVCGAGLDGAPRLDEALRRHGPLLSLPRLSRPGPLAARRRTGDERPCAPPPLPV